MIAVGLALSGTTSLSGLKTEASWRVKAANNISVEEDVNDIKSVDLVIAASGSDERKKAAEMTAGSKGFLYTTVDGTNKEVTYTCDKPQYLVDEKIDTEHDMFQLTSDVPENEVLTFTATSVADPSKTSEATVTVVAKPELKSVEIVAPDGYTIKEDEKGNKVIEVPLGTTSITLKDKIEATGNYKWSPQWKAGVTLKEDGTTYSWTSKLITVNASTGEVQISEDIKEGYSAKITLVPNGYTTPSYAVYIKMVAKATSDIKSVDLVIAASGSDERKKAAEMTAGSKGFLYTTVDGTNKEVTYTCDKPQYLVDEKIDTEHDMFQLTSDVPENEVLTFTATSVADPSKTSEATVTVVAKPELKSVEIVAPDGYTIKEDEKGNKVIEVPLGTTSITLKDKIEATGNYKWSPQWKAGVTLKEDGTTYSWTSKLITVNASTGEVQISEDIKEGYSAKITLVPNGYTAPSYAVYIKMVAKDEGTGTLNGISITAPDGYEINQEGIIEVYANSTLQLTGVPDITSGYKWDPVWSVGDTIDSEGNKNENPYADIKINSETGEVTVPGVAGDGDTAVITLQQKNDNSGIKATVTIKVVYWNVTVSAKPENLQNTGEKVKPARAVDGSIVSFNATYRGATDSNGQKYIFDHWETDDANKDLTNYNRGGLVNGATVGDTFKMPHRDVHLTAVFAKSWDVKEEVIGAGNMPTLFANAFDYPEGKEVDLYYYKTSLSARYLVLQDIKVFKVNGEEVPSHRDESSNSTVHIYFTMPAEEVTVKVTVARDSDADKSLSLGEVTGSLVSGTAGTASAEVTVSGYSDGETLTVGESFADGTLKNESDRTSGLSFAVSSVTDGKAQVTIQIDQTVLAGTYSFTVASSNGKVKVTGKVTVQEAEATILTVKGASIELEEEATGELILKGISLNLKNGTAVKAVETDAKGTEKTFGKTEGLAFDDTTIADNAFVIKAHLSKTVTAGTYYFKVKAGDTVSEAASIVVTRTKKEEPEPTPPVEDKEYSINASCNTSQGTIEIRVNGTEAAKAKKGDKVTLTAIPKSGYKLKNWSLNMDMTTITPSEGTLTDTTISFLMPEGTVTVGAAFENAATENPDTPVSTAPTITAFVVENVNGVIDQSTGQITVVVPNGTDVTALKPAVAVSDGATVTPGSGVAVNFTDAVVYTVKSASGETKQYVVTVKVQEASVSDSLWDQITSPEGDRSWWKKADSIKSHKKNKYPKYW